MSLQRVAISIVDYTGVTIASYGAILEEGHTKAVGLEMPATSSVNSPANHYDVNVTIKPIRCECLNCGYDRSPRRKVREENMGTDISSWGESKDNGD